ncbi:hypothetical protein CRE_11079 [Caenorhabditis remanei]|uniref:DUF4440 domain-containing protein n=2 Tax=Caenorhabditis remanei TaxID=31234 RepID=E3M5F2_CAERE|nr:hypothetical protein CRE_11079 [Caenorhabditis remanei]
MSKEEFQKIHDEMRALKTAGKHDEFAKKFAAKDAIFMGPLHDPCNAADAAKLAGSEKMAALVKSDFNVKIDDITQLGDVVIERCTITAKLPTGDKTGWSLAVWVKEGGAWKIRNSCTTFKAPIPQQ